MTTQTAALPYVIQLCRDADPSCGIRLQGSVARRQEQPDSDIDLTIVMSHDAPLRFNQIIREDNHYGMRLIRLDPCGLDLDINWLRVEELLRCVRNGGAMDWWMFHTGRTLHDPAGLAQQCEAAIAEWYDRNPAIVAAWARQQEEVQKNKQDPNYPLKYANQPQFSAYLRTLLQPNT